MRRPLISRNVRGIRHQVPRLQQPCRQLVKQRRLMPRQEGWQSAICWKEGLWRRRRRWLARPLLRDDGHRSHGRLGHAPLLPHQLKQRHVLRRYAHTARWHVAQWRRCRRGRRRAWRRRRRGRRHATPPPRGRRRGCGLRRLGSGRRRPPTRDRAARNMARRVYEPAHCVLPLGSRALKILIGDAGEEARVTAMHLLVWEPP